MVATNLCGRVHPINWVPNVISEKCIDYNSAEGKKKKDRDQRVLHQQRVCFIFGVLEGIDHKEDEVRREIRQGFVNGWKHWWNIYGGM